MDLQWFKSILSVKTDVKITVKVLLLSLCSREWTGNLHVQIHLRYSAILRRATVATFGHPTASPIGKEEGLGASLCIPSPKPHFSLVGGGGGERKKDKGDFSERWKESRKKALLMVYHMSKSMCQYCLIVVLIH